MTPISSDKRKQSLLTYPKDPKVKWQRLLKSHNPHGIKDKPKNKQCKNEGSRKGSHEIT